MTGVELFSVRNEPGWLPRLQGIAPGSSALGVAPHASGSAHCLCVLLSKLQVERKCKEGQEGEGELVGVRLVAHMELDYPILVFAVGSDINQVGLTLYWGCMGGQYYHLHWRGAMMLLLLLLRCQ